VAKRLSRAHFLILSTTPEGRITAGGWLVTSVHRLPNPITNICQQRQLKMQLGKKNSQTKQQMLIIRLRNTSVFSLHQTLKHVIMLHGM